MTRTTIFIISIIGIIKSKYKYTI